MRLHLKKQDLAAVVALLLLVLACITHAPGENIDLHGWWKGLGPVLPHDTFPADCSICHQARDWQSVREDFSFDHAAETGVPLLGAHANARCLLCHNDRGPVAVFNARGCAGCHEDIHFGQLGSDCTSCHQEQTWYPYGQIELHNRTRLPLTGIHAATACRRCHVGAEVGKFVPTDPECVTCHQDDLARATNPNHIGLGWVDRCDRCHQPTTWNQFQFNP
jgi:hypothetical protein